MIKYKIISPLSIISSIFNTLYRHVYKKNYYAKVPEMVTHAYDVHEKSARTTEMEKKSANS